MRLSEQTATDLLTQLGSGKLSSVELVNDCLEASKNRDGKLKAFLHLDSKKVLAQAEAVDAKRKKGEKLGRLAGIPVAIKDVLCVQGEPTTCGSKMLQKFVPPYNAHVIELLKQEDAVLFGKCNMDEFAMGSSTENSAYGPSRNPWNTDYVPGGSSGGSAVAVAGGLAPLSLGTDTGGSIRQPASLCGIVGMKPTYGRVSRYGMVAFASSLDQIGPFSHSVADAALLLTVIAGHDKRDSTSIPKAVPDYTASLKSKPGQLRIGLPKEFFTGEGLSAEVSKAVQEAIKQYEKLGAKLVNVSLPHSKYAISVYYIVATAEASSNLARYDGVHYGHRSSDHDSLIHMYSRSRGQGFGKEVKRRIMLGTYALSSGYYDAYYKKALQVRRLIKNDFDTAFKECDVILGPTAPSPAFKIGEKSKADPIAMYLSDIYTISCNLAGIAGISIPCGFSSDKLPIGLQLLGPEFSEETLLRTAYQFEQSTNWHQQRPTFA